MTEMPSFADIACPRIRHTNITYFRNIYFRLIQNKDPCHTFYDMDLCNREL